MKRIVLVATMLVLLGGGARADVPALLNFTGSLATGAGPYEGPAQVTLAFYPDQAGPTPVWSDTQEVYVQAGRFYVLLGADPMNPLPSGVFDGQDLFLGVRVDNNPEMTPRLRVTSVPYAMRAADAGLLGGLPPGAFAEKGHTHEFADLNGVVPEGALPDSVVLSAELTDLLGGYVTITTFQEGLAGKSDVGHGHAVGDVAGLQAAAEGWARGVCFDTAEEIAGALPGWDQDFSDDLTTTTPFGGDVSGTYQDLQIGTGAVGNNEIDNNTRYVSVRDSSNAQQFVVTDGAPSLRFVGSGGAVIGFEASNQAVTVSADANYLQRRVTGTCPSGQYIRAVAGDGGVTCEGDRDTLGGLSCSGSGVARYSQGSWACSSLVPVANGGTNSTATPTKGAVAYGTGSAYAFTAAPPEVGVFLRGDPAGAPSWGSLKASDLPSGSDKYIWNQGAVTQNASFRVSGDGHVGGELWVGPTGRIRLHNMETGGSIQTGPHGFVEYAPTSAGTPRMRVGATSESVGPATLELTSGGSVVVTTGLAAVQAAVFYPPTDENGDGTYDAVSVGHGFHAIGANIHGATIGGGGQLGRANKVLASFSTIGGGSNNTASGYSSTLAGGADNTADGWYSTLAGGSNNSASGYYSTVAGGSNNSASGSFSTVAGGSYNTANGWYSTVAGGANNSASGSYAFAAGHRAKADAPGCFVWADWSNADLACAHTNGFYARATGGFRLFTNTTATPKCTLTNGDFTWTCTSDRNAKADLVLVDPADVLDRVMEVPVYTFRMKDAPPDVRHMGPMAQDFHRAFHLGDSDTMISQGDVGGVALAAIQGLHLENRALRDENAALRARVESLESRLLRLERRVSR